MSLALAGHNQPPSPLEFAQEAMTDLSDFLEGIPVIETEDHASQAGLLVERVRKTLQDVEDDRVRQTKPLNETVARINEKYHAVHNENKNKPGSADKLLNELKRRLTAYAQAEEAKRIAAAEAARQAAAEAERAAREAEAREREAIENAKQGELTDVGAAVRDADQSFLEFQKANRVATRAEREVPVRISSALGGRSLSMRTTETLVVTDAQAAIRVMGLTDKIRDAILSSARDFRKEFDELPEGVTATYERSL